MSLSASNVTDINPRAETFYDRLFYNPEYCSNCFTRIRRIDPFLNEDRIWGGVLATHPTEHRDLTEDAMKGHDGHEPDDLDDYPYWHAEMESPHRKTFCEECGRDGTAQTDSLPLSDMMQYAERIARHLTRMGIDVDLDRMRDCIRYLRAKNDLEGYNDAVFAWATAKGIQTAERRH